MILEILKLFSVLRRFVPPSNITVHMYISPTLYAQLLSEEFEDNDEFRLFVRRVDKLIPERLDGISSTVRIDLHALIANMHEHVTCYQNRLCTTRK